MENKNKLSCEQARDLDIVSYLAKLGYEPARIRNLNYWFMSPLRNEKTPSFKVNKRLNRWYDHGIGKGGNLIDFGILYHHCSVTELLQLLSGDLSFQKPFLTRFPLLSTEDKIVIQDTAFLSSAPLLQYLEDRAILLSIAAQYCVELYYTTGGKSYQSIALRNDSGGYEIRSPYFKGSSSPKDITTIRNGDSTAVVFEGMFDFLSYKTYCHVVNRKGNLDGDSECDYVILNSLALFEKARHFIEQHSRIILYLDSDEAGQNCSIRAKSLSDRYHDSNCIYKGYKDFNEWLMNGSDVRGFGCI